MVRQPRDDGLLGRRLAERELRVPHGDPPDRAPGAHPGCPHRLLPPPGRHGGGVGRGLAVLDHPVRAQVGRPEEISQIFDEISYGKGSSILGMLEAYLGPDRFRAGVVDYLERFRYANARTEDLWEALERAGHEPVAAMATPWIDRPGHPVITARRDGGTLHLSQRRFTFLPSRSDEPPWPIPLVMDIDDERRRLAFSDPEAQVSVPADAVIHLNPGAVGFYRVQYDRGLLDCLLEALPSRNATDRWSVLENLGAFLLSGEADWPTYVRFVRGVGATNDLLVVNTLAGDLSALGRILPSVGAVQDEGRRYYADRLDAIGVQRRPDEPAAIGILRERLTGYRVRADEGFARDLAELFPERSRLDPDLRAAVAVAWARTEGRAGWIELRRALHRATTEAEILQLGRALAWTTEPDQLGATLDMTLSGEIASGHAALVVTQATLNPRGGEVVWPWMTRHLDQLAERFRGSMHLSLLLERTAVSVGLGRADEVNAFYREHPFPEGSRGLAKGLERLEVAERLRGRSGSFQPG